MQSRRVQTQKMTVKRCIAFVEVMIRALSRQKCQGINANEVTHLELVAMHESCVRVCLNEPP